jgi:hypothetical protein
MLVKDYIRTLKTCSLNSKGFVVTDVEKRKRGHR